MNVRELMYAKKAQREFRALFGKDLVIDFPTMNGEEKELIPSQELEIYRDSLLKKYKLSEEDLVEDRRNKKRTDKGDRIRLFMTEFSKHIVKNKFDPHIASELVGKHRTTLYHYAKGEHI